MGSQQIDKIISELKEKHEVDLHDLYFELKKNLLDGHIMVFTQEGNPVMLPENSTCLDFAYKVDPIMGDNAVSAVVNGENVGLNAVLSNEDTVKIIQSKLAKCPNHEWLNFAKTENAIERIKYSLKQECFEVKRKIGCELLQQECDRLGVGDIEDFSRQQLTYIKEHWAEVKIKNMNEVFAAVAEGLISPIDVINVVYNKSKLAKAVPIRKPRKEDFKNMKDLERVKLKLLCEFDADALKVVDIVYKSKVLIIYSHCSFSILRQMAVYKFEFAFQTYQQMLDVIKAFEQVKGVVKVQRDFLRKRIMFLSFAFICLFASLKNPIMLTYGTGVWGYNEESDYIWVKILLFAGLVSLILMLQMIRSKIGFISRRVPGKVQLLIAYPVGIFTTLSIVHVLMALNNGVTTTVSVLAILAGAFLLYLKHAKYLRNRKSAV